MSFLSQPITLQSIFGQSRMIGPVTVQVIINEETVDNLTITKQPVQQGASITDHSYIEPTVLSMNILQQNNNLISGLTGTFSAAGTNGLAIIYQQFLTLQGSRSPFNVLTPKRVYKNMLISSIRMVTDKNTENILALNVSMQQIIIVSIGVALIPASQQKNPAVTQATQNVGKQSALFSASQAIQSLFSGVK
jgi:hypothetical protein